MGDKVKKLAKKSSPETEMDAKKLSLPGILHQLGWMKTYKYWGKKNTYREMDFTPQSAVGGTCSASSLSSTGGGGHDWTLGQLGSRRHALDSQLGQGLDFRR